MNISKYLLLSVSALVFPMVQVKAEESAVTTAQEHAVTNTEAPAADSAVANNKEDEDFATWAKNLELSDAEKEQFLSEMDEVTQTNQAEEAKKSENHKDLSEDKKHEPVNQETSGLAAPAKKTTK